VKQILQNARVNVESLLRNHSVKRYSTDLLLSGPAPYLGTKAQVKGKFLSHHSNTNKLTTKRRKQKAIMTLTVHHLQVSQSERVVWLCEELGIDYELKIYQRDPLFAPADYKALHPTGSAPVIEDNDKVLAESAACVEYIAQVYGRGRFFVKPGDENYADFLYYFHFANGE